MTMTRVKQRNQTLEEAASSKLNSNEAGIDEARHNLPPQHVRAGCALQHRRGSAALQDKACLSPNKPTIPRR